MKPVLASINRSYVICLLVFLLFAGIGAYWTHMGQTLYRKEQRFYMNELIQSQAYAIERRLQRSLSATRILAQAVRQHGGMLHDFDAYAAEVLDSLDGIANLQLAPDGIVRRIYPLAGNERALGHNLLGDQRRAAEAQQAIEQRRLTLAGPMKLVQGGVAVIGRNPVFLADGSGERFWGFTSAVILLDDLLAVTDLGPHGRSEYSYQLSRTHPDSGQEEVFSRSASALTRDSYSVALEVPGSRWQLTMSRAKPTPKW
ncbi:MAG TPA: CHASE domain-containing protein, partial [Motiliproteus sp.]